MNRRLAALLIAGVLLAALPAAAKADKPLALPFIENDFDKALAAAKAAEKPLFVEVWAPW